MEANWVDLLLQSLPMLAGPVAVWLATMLVTKLKPSISGKVIVGLVVPFFSFLAAAVTTWLGAATNPFLLLFLNTMATFIHQVIKQWNQPA